MMIEADVERPAVVLGNVPIPGSERWHGKWDGEAGNSL